jgi:hypothetical protein
MSGMYMKFSPKQKARMDQFPIECKNAYHTISPDNALLDQFI